MRPRLKVCGVKDAAFAEEATRRGIDYLGVIFAAKSPRRVSVETARMVASAVRTAAPVRPPKIVGVFVEQTADEIFAVASAVPLDVVQLHGAYSDGDVTSLKAAGFEVWRLAVENDGGTGTEDAVLLDGRFGGQSGGTGRLADWSQVERLKRSGRRVVLAGGLSAENVASAAATGADVLDFNSSLETAPGVKSVELLDRLLILASAIRCCTLTKEMVSFPKSHVQKECVYAGSTETCCETEGK